MTILESDDAEMYRLVEDENGKVVLEIVLGDVGWYEMRIPLTAGEIARYRDEGHTFLHWLIARVREAPGDYRR